jgi:hypothetical protein
MLNLDWTYQIGVVPGEGTSLHVITHDVQASQTHGSSNHLRDIQIRVLLGNAILEYFDVFDYDHMGSWGKVFGQANARLHGVAYGDLHQQQESRRDNESCTHYESCK